MTIAPSHLPNERVVPDDYPIYGDYIYLADGKPVRSDYHNITAREFRARINAEELRNCDVVGRNLI